VVAWEGTDGSGKTTLMNEVSRILRGQGYRVSFYKTPSDTETGRLAKTLGGSKAIDPLTRMLLFLANTSSDSILMRREIEEKNPDFYFIDRYYLCSLVYGLALIGLRRGAEARGEELMSWLGLVEEAGSTIFIKPDLYVIIVVEEETRRRRLGLKLGQHDAAYEQDARLQLSVKRLYEEFRDRRGGEVIWSNNPEGELAETSGRLAQLILEARTRFSSRNRGPQDR